MFFLILILIYIIFLASILAFFLWFFFTVAFPVAFKEISDSIRRAAQNYASPLLSREAHIVRKRKLQYVMQGNEVESTVTVYYLTLKFTDGSRKKFKISGKEYELLVEGDRGMLQTQGTWYKGFNRL